MLVAMRQQKDMLSSWSEVRLADRSSDFVTSRAGVDLNTGLSIERGLPLRSRNAFAKLAAAYLLGLLKRTASRRTPIMKKQIG